MESADCRGSISVSRGKSEQLNRLTGTCLAKSGRSHPPSLPSYWKQAPVAAFGREKWFRTGLWNDRGLERSVIWRRPNLIFLSRAGEAACEESQWSSSSVRPGRGLGGPSLTSSGETCNHLSSCSGLAWFTTAETAGSIISLKPRTEQEGCFQVKFRAPCHS